MSDRSGGVAALLILVCLAVLLPKLAHSLATYQFGNAPVGAQDDWKPGVLALVNDKSRVYRVWVNGNENFCFRGDTEKLNQALKNFAAIQDDVREVILMPYPGVAACMGRLSVACDWSLHVPSGLYLYHSLEEKGTRVRTRHATLTILADSHRLDLSKLKIPPGVTVLEVGDLIDRYLEGLGSSQAGVRRDAVLELAEFPWHSRAPEVVAAVSELLQDDEEDVRNIAAYALGHLGKVATAARPALRRRLADPSEEVRGTAREALEAIDSAADPLPGQLQPKQAAILEFLGKRK